MENNLNDNTPNRKVPWIVAAIALTVIIIISVIIMQLAKQEPLAQNENSNHSPAESGTQTISSTESQPSTQPVDVQKSYTLTEIASHNSEKDCWMAIEQKVYNVTEFVSSHPGGKAILGGCGQDATKLFNERPTNDKGPHPAQAKTILEKYYIGELK